MDTSITTKKKKVWYYLPYLPVFCFCTEVVGVAVWDQYSRKALSGSKSSLEVLGINSIQTRLVWGSEALAFTVAMTIILALCMLALGTGRSFIAYQADRTGATRMGGRLITWMILCAVFIVLWFLLTFWLLLLLLGQCLWMAAAWGLNMSMQVGSESARSNAAIGNNDTILHINETASNCSLSCVDLAAFDWALGNHTCFCQLATVDQADKAMQDALGYLAGSVAGAVMLLISSMWVLMASSSEFGVTRRERQLLRRIAKARMAAAVAAGNTERSKLLPGKLNGSGMGFGKKGKDKSAKGGAAGGSGAAAPDGADGAAAADNVIVDHETGEVLDVEMAASAAATSSNKASSGPDGLRRSSSLVKLSKGLAKGVSKTGQAFELIGGYLSRGRTK